MEQTLEKKLARKKYMNDRARILYKLDPTPFIEHAKKWRHDNIEVWRAYQKMYHRWYRVMSKYGNDDPFTQERRRQLDLWMKENNWTPIVK